MPDEPSLRMAWYPKGRLPRHPFPYYTETMTGFEYVVAANLAQRGDFARAERVVRDIRSRFDGRKRNPFDETECGHHYARALAAWSVLQAFDASALAVETDAVTGGIRELRIAGDESGMNWVRRADGVEFKWIGPEYMWGTGTLKVDGRPTAWSRASACGSNVVYRIDGGLEVSCARRNEDGSLYERYALRNGGARAVKLSEIDIHTPFRDDYLPSGELRARRCHAHVWPGGSGAWVCAMRMGGAAPHIGLAVVEGRITGYELKERALEKGMSNTRGVIALSLPDVTLAPGEETAVAWRVFPHRGREDFLERVRGFGGVTASAPDWTVDAKHPVEVTFRAAKGNALDGAEIVGEGVAVVGTRREGTSLVATCAYRKDGEARVRCRLRSGYETFAELLCRGDPDALVRARAAFIVRNQVYRGATADDPRDGALVEYDNETNAQYRRWEHSAAERLAVDHNEGAERVAMGIFLARLAAAGHKECLPVVERYARFVRRGLQDPDYTTWGEVDRNSRRRLYNYPWVAEFQVAAYRATGDRRHLLDAYGTLMRSFAQLKTLVLVESPEAEVFRALAEAGCRDESAKLLAAMRAHKDAVMARSSCTEEVNFAPEMVAGELTQFLDLWRLTGEDKYRRHALERILPMFEACLGPQPSWHSHDIGMHHWDGYWFGKRQCWGDTLPHDWNGTGADVFARLADATGDAAYRVRARAVVRQLLGLFDADGRAGCAWVLPDRVNGRPARFRDPLANDQDWALVFYLRNGRWD